MLEHLGTCFLFFMDVVHTKCPTSLLLTDWHKGDKAVSPSAQEDQFLMIINIMEKDLVINIKQKFQDRKEYVAILEG